MIYNYLKEDYKMENKNIEKIFKYGFIIFSFISLIITTLNLTYLTYQDARNIQTINNLLVNYVNKTFWIENIILYIFAIGYIIISIKSKKDVLFKVSFCIFSILTSMIILTLIINILASAFGLI